MHQSASAADLPADAGAFSGAARNYGVFAGVGLLNDSVNARANIAESVVAVNSEGLSQYDGTGVGDYAVPGTVANDPTARAYSRAAPVGAGFTGLNLNPVRSQSTSTTVQETANNDQDFGAVDLSPLATLDALTGSTKTAWTDDVLNDGGVVASSSSNTGNLQLVPRIEAGGAPVPGVSRVLPLGQANLGQNTNEVRLVASPTATCPAALAAETTSTWKFADVQLFGGNVGVSWGGESGADDTGTITARTTGQPGGATLTVSQLPTMTVQIGGPNGRAVQIEPGAAIEISDLFAGSQLGSALSRIVDGQLAYGGTTNVVQTADGTRASGSMNGLNADLTLLPVPVVAPSGLGSAELGFERVDVDSTMQAGGLHCTETGSNADADATTATNGATNADATTATNGATNADATTATNGATNADATTATNGATNADATTATNGATNADATTATNGATDADATTATNGATDADATTATNGATDADATTATNGATNADATTATNGATNADATTATNGATDADATTATNGATNTNASASAAADAQANAAAQAAAQANATTAASAAANSDATAAAQSASNSTASANASQNATSNADAAAAAAAQAASNGDNSSDSNADTSAAGNVSGASAAQAAAISNASTNASANASGTASGATTVVTAAGASNGAGQHHASGNGGSLAFTGADRSLMVGLSATAIALLLMGGILAAAAARRRRLKVVS
ncbi:hypothetical protein KZI27_00080 (plasmid) [Curtobacterium sp. TC1]|uniref:hypothetical protein n=1 Tax=Curtobacterium sp. TC1 TaxID=2862880 RepID=UPI001C9AEC75|nr:hypothetical protein [Curtobacterium sp. TC1]QZQ53675.1 hypothetical protein KZI27_00080 [Curtobacterium sp. TC1]